MFVLLGLGFRMGGFCEGKAGTFACCCGVLFEFRVVFKSE